MKTFLLLLAIFALTVSAVPVEEEDSEYINGENGWFVPQEDGSFEWISKDEAEELLADLEEQSAAQGRLFANTVKFFLITNEKPDEFVEMTANFESIEAAGFKADRPTRFIVHGWQSDSDNEWQFNIAKAWFSRGEYNIISVDWRKARSINYISAVGHVSKVGEKVADMINFLKNKVGMSLQTTHCIGHSLGAHVCGYAGKNTDGKLGTIVGLDPALPLFNYNNKLRLCDDDADYVETIQTNGGKLGFLKPIGKSAFYPNGGKKQPGCGLDLTGACSHCRSYQYYAAAIENDNFPSTKCPSYKDATKKECGSTYSSFRMCAASNALSEGGQFYVPVSKNYPFGFGTD